MIAYCFRYLPGRFIALVTLSLLPMLSLADPLAETREVIFSGDGFEIAEKALELQSPAAMYEYVRNTHEYALYHGSRQNSINTFLGQRGSDVDIASVLIAMYRSQKIPARYAKGTVRMTEADVMNWLGVKDISLAKAIMRDQGIQGVSPYLTNNGQFVDFEHAWVQVQVPYDDYRGAYTNGVNCSTTPNRCVWIDVDPSFKLRQYHNQNIDVYNVVNFNYDSYYNAILNDDPDYRDKNPLEIYEEQILNYLETNFPGKTLEDVADPGTIILVDDGILPASLPYEVIGSVGTYDSVDDHDTPNAPDWAKYLDGTFHIEAHVVGGGTITLSPGMGGPHALADLSTKRLTVTYSPSSVNGNEDRVEVRLDGNLVATPFKNSGPIQFPLLTPFSLDLTIDGSPGIDGSSDNVVQASYNNFVVGGYYLIGTGGDTSNWSQVHRAADALLEANEQYSIETDDLGTFGPVGTPYVDTNQNGSIDSGEPPLLESPNALDALTGGLLEVAMRQYFTQFVEQTRRLDQLNHVLSPIEGFVGIVSSTYDVEYLDDTAFSVMPDGLLIDMKGVTFNGNWVDDQPATFASAHSELVGHLSSSLEHEIWQQLTGYDAVSTVRGIQMALANGASLQRPENDGVSDNMASQFPGFRFDDSPTGFTFTPFDVFGTQPATWTHATNGAEMEVLKRNVTTSDTSLQRKLAPYQYNTAGGFYGWVACTDNYEEQVKALSSGFNGTVNYFCDGAQFSGTRASILSQSQTYFQNTVVPNYIGQNLFDFFDQAKGFDRLEHVYRPLPLATDEHDAVRIQDIRDDVALGNELLIDGQNGRWEYVIPSRKTEGAKFRFTVFLEKVFSQVTGALARQNYIISNDIFLAGGGWVDGTKTLVPGASLPGTGTVQPTFNNEVFTESSLVSHVNNDLVKTPSTSDPISTVTGNMYHDETDFTIKGRGGLNYTFTRSYNSGPARSDVDGPLGYGWTHSYNMSLRSNDYGDCPDCTQGTGPGQKPENGNGVTASITYIDERGGEHTYLRDESTGIITPPPGEFDSLQPNTPSSGLHTLQFRNGVKYVFSGPSNLNTVPGTARLSYIEDAYNNRLTMTYDGSNRLSSVTDNLSIAGRTGLTFSYTGASQLIDSVSDWSGRTWQFGYDTSRLTTVTNPRSDIVTYTYHGSSNLLNEMIMPEDRGGQQAKNVFTYYRNNKAFTQKNALNQGETVDYDLYRQRTQITDARGYTRTHSYDTDNGALIKLEEPDGAILRFENNADGLRYTKRDGLGFLTQYSFQADRSVSANASDNNGLVSREIDALTRTIDYDYGIYDQPTTVTDKRGNPVTRIYYPATDAGDAVQGRLHELRATVDGVANTILARYKYYTSGPAFGQVKQRIEFIDPANSSRRRVTDYVYESNGINLQTLTVTGATGGGSVTTTYTYDSLGLGRVETETLQRRTSATNATLLNLTTTYTYDQLGRVTHVENPRGDIQETVFDDNGKVYQQKVHYLTTTPRPNCAAPSGGYVVCTYVTNTYDAADRLTETTDILGQSTSFEYDASGNLVKQTDANDHSTEYEYDGMNRRTAIIDANGYRTEFKYDLAGRPKETSDANGHVTTNTYDELGRLTEVTSEEGRKVQTQYDENGNATHVIDANAVANGSHPRNTQSASVYREYDELNRLTLERDALNGDTQYEYDLLGNITKITDAEGQITDFVYDDLGRLVETIDPLIESGTDKTDQVLLYDEAGNALLTEDRTGRQRRHSYDTLNRLTRIDYLQDSTFNQWDYDDFGDLVAVSNDDVTYDYAYTPRHEMESKTDSRLGKSLVWTYDPVGNVETKTDYQGDVTTYQYDSTNLLVAMRNPAYLQVSYHYDGAGRLIDRILSNGAKTHYGYDDDNRLTNLRNYSGSQTLVEDLSYQHDEVGNITQIADAVSGRTVDYGYDALYRLTSVDSTTNSEDRTYTYDAVGNRKTETKNGTTYYYCYHATNCSAGPTGNRLHNIRTGSLTGALFRQFTYDDAGRVTQKRDGSGSNLYTVTYNGKGRASQVNSTTFDYDPNDYRIRNGSKLHHLEGEHLEATYSTTGTLEKKYLRGSVIDEIVNGYFYPDYASNPNNFTNYTFHHDQVNSVTALTGHNGTTEETTQFDAFGAPLSLTIPGTGNDLLFTGREYDQPTGLYYYRARYYDSELGRFLSEDPLGFQSGDTNFYAYVNNNPVNYNDPMGLEKQMQINLDAVAFWGRLHRPAGDYIEYVPGQGGRMVTHPDRPGSANGSSLGMAVGISIGDSIADTQLYVDFHYAPFSKGEGAYAGAGTGLTFSSTDGPLPALTPIYSESQHTEINAALVAGGGAAWDKNTSGNLESVGVAGKFGAGLGLMYAKGTSNSVRVSTPTLGDIWDSVVGSSSAGGGFVLYPSKPNTNMMESVYKK